MGELAMAQRLRSLDWSRTPVGPRERWPTALRAAVDIMLAQPVAMLILWGPDLVAIYNDAQAAMLGQKHPSALGRPVRDIWPEVSGSIHEETVGRALSGESVLIEDQLVPTTRHGPLGDAWYTYSMGPLHDDAGGVAGVFVVTTETTPRVVAERERARRRDLEAMREHDAEYRSLFEAMDEGFLLADVIFDDAGRAVDLLYLAANPAATRMTRTEFVGRHLTEIEASYEPYWLELWGRVAQTGVGERHVRYAAPLDGWFDFYLFRIGGDASRRVAVVFSDVTDRRRRESHAAFLAELSEDFAHLTLPDELMQRIGAKIGAYLDLATCDFVDVDLAHVPELTVGYRWRRHDAPELPVTFNLKEYISDDFARANQAGETTVIGDTQTDPRTDAAPFAALNIHAVIGVPFFRDGTWRYLLSGTGTRPRVWRPDEIELFRSVANMVFPRLERARSDAALRESEERLRLVVENARDHAVFTLALDGRVATWNPGAARIFGYASEEIIGQPISLLFPDERAAAAELNTAARDGQSSDDRWQRRKNGTQFWANGVTSAMRDASGHLRGFTKVLRDMTGPKLVEQERERLLEQEQIARAAAERATLMKDEFLAVVSHELRTPVAAMLLWSKLLRDGVLSGPDQAEAFDAIARSAEAQRQLIEDLLDVSRMTTGKLHLEIRDADLDDIVRDAAETVRPMAEAKGVTLDVAPDLAGAQVRVDPDRLQQVLWNVLNNAVKFTPAGGSVRVVTRPVDGHARVEVRDTGRGITAGFLPHVFDRFRQQDASTTRTTGGLGLGLSIARQIVELHGGTIRAESEGSDKGATFTIDLPLPARTPRAPPARPAAPPAARPPLPARALAGARVLLVEDEPITRAAIVRLLRVEGAEVDAVDSAAAAVEACHGEPGYDVLVSDIGLPGRSGYELMLDWRAREHAAGRRATPAIALTAYARPDDRARSADAGFQTHLAKPIDPAALIAAIAALVGHG